MLVDKYGSIDYDIGGVVTKTNNVILSENQFLQWTNTGKRLELWEGKNEYLNYEYDHDINCRIRRIKYWSENSIFGFLPL